MGNDYDYGLNIGIISNLEHKDEYCSTLSDVIPAHNLSIFPSYKYSLRSRKQLLRIKYGLLPNRKGGSLRAWIIIYNPKSNDG